MKRTQQWARVTTTTHNYPLECVYIHKTSHKWCWWRLNDDDEREKVWLAWVEIYCEMRNYFLQFLSSFFVYMLKKYKFKFVVMRNFFYFTLQKCICVREISFQKYFYDIHAAWIFHFLFHMLFLTNAYTAINNEVKIAWMCIKCIITHGAVNDDERRICVTKNALWRTFVY